MSIKTFSYLILLYCLLVAVYNVAYVLLGGQLSAGMQLATSLWMVIGTIQALDHLSKL